MKAIGIGVDIEQVDRFSKLTKALDTGFLDRIFTEKEQDYCFTYKAAGSHLAVRYAGKEAVIKALTELDRAKDIFYKDIEIINNENKVPVVYIQKDSCRDLQVNISFSHTNDTAIAFCVITLISKRSSAK
jgi:holo-[acyl-carrier protein] synthase